MVRFHLPQKFGDAELLVLREALDGVILHKGLDNEVLQRGLAELRAAHAPGTEEKDEEKRRKEEAERRKREAMALLLIWGWTLLRGLEEGRREPDAVNALLRQVLGDAYEQAFAAGKALAGEEGALTFWDRRALRGIIIDEWKYLRGVIGDVAAGKGRMDYGRRLMMYATALNEPFWAGWARGAPKTASIRWNLGQAEHCELCPKLAERSPYTVAEFLRLGYFPQSGKLPCGVNCHCYLTREGG